jgi:hypothetical protein
MNGNGEKGKENKNRGKVFKTKSDKKKGGMIQKNTTNKKQTKTKYAYTNRG